MFYDEFSVGMVINHAVRRTITETDNVLITALTMNPQPLHMDETAAAESMYGARLVNSLITLGLTGSLTVTDISLGSTLGNLGYESVRFPKPVFVGDTIHSRTEVLSMRHSTSRPEAGIVEFAHVGLNQRDEIVCECRRFGLMLRSAPTAPTVAG